MDRIDALPDVRYWAEVLCCTIMIHISDQEVKVKDFKSLSYVFLLKSLEVFIF